MCRIIEGNQNAEHTGLLLRMDKPCRSLQRESWGLTDACTEAERAGLALQEQAED